MNDERHEHDVPVCGARSTELLSGSLGRLSSRFPTPQSFAARLPPPLLCEDPALAARAGRDHAVDPALGGAVARHPPAQAAPDRPHDLAPLTELGGYVALLALALILGLMTASTGCATSLETHERMAALVHSAVRACKEDGTTCPSALLCARAARDAGRAIQAARQLQADGREDAEVTARALAAQRVAQDACRRAGLKGDSLR